LLVRFDHQDAPRKNVNLDHPLATLVALGYSEASGEREDAAFAELAFHLNLAAHHANETLTDSEPEACATVTAHANTVELREYLVELGQITGLDPDAGVANGGANDDALIVADRDAEINEDFTTLDEL